MAWLNIAAYWRWVITVAVSAMTAATMSAIVAAHLTRNGTMRWRLFSSSAASISTSTLVRASASSLPLAQRRSGVFASDRDTTRRNAAGTSGRSCSIGFGSAVAICIASETRLSPWNGRWPVSIWYSTMPAENRSERPSSLSPLACSGDMYCGVPRMSPRWVRCSAPDDSTCAMPKSVTFTVCVPLTCMMLPGLMSRWTMPRECA